MPSWERSQVDLVAEVAPPAEVDPLDLDITDVESSASVATYAGSGSTKGEDDGAAGEDDGAAGEDDGADGEDDGAGGSGSTKSEDDGADGEDDGADGEDDGADAHDGADSGFDGTPGPHYWRGLLTPFSEEEEGPDGADGADAHEGANGAVEDVAVEDVAARVAPEENRYLAWRRRIDLLFDSALRSRSRSRSPRQGIPPEESDIEQ